MLQSDGRGRAALARFIRAAAQRSSGAASAITTIIVRGGLSESVPERVATLSDGTVLRAADGEATDAFQRRVAAAARQSGSRHVIYGGLPDGD